MSVSSTDWRRFQTARLCLSPFRGDDAERAYALEAFNIVEVVTQLSNPPYPYKNKDFDAFAAKVEKADPDKSPVWNIILRDGSAEPIIGGISLNLVEEGRWNLGYSMLPNHWGRGYMSEAVGAVCEFAFDVMGATCVDAGVFDDNLGSRRVLEKCGFSIVRQGGTTSAGRNDSIEYPSTFYELSAEGFATFRTRAGCHSYTSIVHRELPIVTVAAAAMVNLEGEILVAQRPQGKSMAGLWEFPGGKLEVGETPEAALIRELHEELGIDTDHSCLSPVAFASHSYAKFHLMMPVFAIRQWRGDILGREGQALKWVKPRELWNVSMPPADEPIIPLLIDLI